MHVHIILIYIYSNKGGDDKHSIGFQSFYINAPKCVLGCIGRHTGFWVFAVLLFLQLYVLDFYKSTGAAAKVIYTLNTHTHTHMCTNQNSQADSPLRSSLPWNPLFKTLKPPMSAGFKKNLLVELSHICKPFQPLLLSWAGSGRKTGPRSRHLKGIVYVRRYFCLPVVLFAYLDSFNLCCSFLEISVVEISAIFPVMEQDGTLRMGLKVF